MFRKIITNIKTKPKLYTYYTVSYSVMGQQITSLIINSADDKRTFPIYFMCFTVFVASPVTLPFYICYPLIM